MVVVCQKARHVSLLEVWDLEDVGESTARLEGDGWDIGSFLGVWVGHLLACLSTCPVKMNIADDQTYRNTGLDLRGSD